MTYPSTPAADAAIAALSQAFRKLLAKDELSLSQYRGLARCLMVLLEFPRIDRTHCVDISIGPKAIHTPAGVLSLSLSVEIVPESIEVSIEGHFRDTQHEFLDSITMCNLSADCDSVEYDDYRRAHAHAIGDVELPAFDCASLGILGLEDLTVHMEVDLFDDEADAGSGDRGGNEDDGDDCWVIRGNELIAADWCDDASLRNLNELPQGILRLCLCNSQVSDTGVATIVDYPALTAVNLSATDIGDVGVEHLAKMRGLEELELGYTAITDKSLEALRKFPRLTRLGIRGTRTTPEGLQHLHDIPSLRHIDASRLNGSSDACVRVLATMHAIESLYIAESNLSGKCLEVLAGHAGLQHLNVSDNPISDDDVRLVWHIPLLKRLDLSGTMITDMAIGDLARCTALRSLDVSDTFITSKGYEDLCRLVPACEVVWRPRQVPNSNSGANHDIPF